MHLKKYYLQIFFPNITLPVCQYTIYHFKHSKTQSLYKIYISICMKMRLISNMHVSTLHLGVLCIYKVKIVVKTNLTQDLHIWKMWVCAVYIIRNKTCVFLCVELLDRYNILTVLGTQNRFAFHGCLLATHRIPQIATSSRLCEVREILLVKNALVHWKGRV